eukprot:5336763-Pyramimonas_sp.AAC.1
MSDRDRIQPGRRPDQEDPPSWHVQSSRRMGQFRCQPKVVKRSRPGSERISSSSVDIVAQC